MKKRINETVSIASTLSKKIISPYVTAGFPTPSMTVDIMHRLVTAGADIIELGLPFSEPMAEGPVIQKAMEVALKAGTTTKKVLSMVETFRKTNTTTPIILMGYLNPIETFGYENFARSAKKAGVDGTIIVDLPPEEAKEVLALWHKYELAMIFLCSSTTSDKRMQLIKEVAEGYLYYVSLKGVTGANTLDVAAVKKDYLQKKENVSLPLLVGFGIKTPLIAQEITRFADGVVIGAAIINLLNQFAEKKEVCLQRVYDFLVDVRKAVDKVHKD